MKMKYLSSSKIVSNTNKILMRDQALYSPSHSEHSLNSSHGGSSIAIAVPLYHGKKSGLKKEKTASKKDSESVTLKNEISSFKLIFPPFVHTTAPAKAHNSDLQLLLTRVRATLSDLERQPPQMLSRNPS